MLWRKFGDKFGKVRNMYLYGDRGRSPRRKQIYGNLSRKINGNLQFLDSSNENFVGFDLLIEFSRIFCEIRQ